MHSKSYIAIFLLLSFAGNSYAMDPAKARATRKMFNRSFYGAEKAELSAACQLVAALQTEEEWESFFVSNTALRQSLESLIKASASSLPDNVRHIIVDYVYSNVTRQKAEAERAVQVQAMQAEHDQERRLAQALPLDAPTSEGPTPVLSAAEHVMQRRMATQAEREAEEKRRRERRILTKDERADRLAACVAERLS